MKSWASGSAALLVLTAFGGVASAEDATSSGDVTPGASGPSGATVERFPPSTVRLPLILGGLGFTAVAYGATALTSYGWPEAPGASELRIPIAGPWLALANNRCPSTEPDCGAIVYARGILEVVSGLAQLGGLVLAAEGIFVTTEAAAGKPALTATRRTPSAMTRITLVPSVTPTLAGVAFVGAF